jgi:hypothetical protein
MKNQDFPPNEGQD